MALSLSDIDRELAARSQSGNSASDEIDAELKRRGVQTEEHKENPSFMQSLGKAQSQIESTMPFVAGMVTPGLGIATEAVQRGTRGLYDAAGKGGELAAEQLAKSGANPYLSAGVGTAIQMAPDIAGSLIPGPKFGNARAFVPAIPAERQAAVAAAREAGMPLTRAEMTGGKSASALENFLEKTPLGSGPLDRLQKLKESILQRNKQALQEKLGTPQDVYSVGQEAQKEIPKRSAAMVSKRNEMFDAIPDNVSIPPNKTRNMADTLIQEQSKYIPTTRNKDVTAIAGDIQNIAIDGKPNYEQIKRLRETLGGKISEATDAKRFTEARDYERLKSALDQDINNFVEGQTRPLDSMVANEFAQSYKKANAFSGAYKNLFKSDEAQKLLESPPEKVVDILFKKNNETAIKQFRALAGEDGFSAVKQKFTNDLLESNNVLKELAKYKPGTLNAVYTAPELKEIHSYGLRQSISKTVSSLQGTAGSARSNIQGGQYTGLGAGIASSAIGNIPGAAAGIGQFLAPAALSRLYTATSNGIPLPINAASSLAAKTGAMQQRNQVPVEQLIQQLIQKFKDKRVR